MEDKHKLFLFILVVILITSGIILYLNYNPLKWQTKLDLETAITQAKYVYRFKKDRGEDFSNGSCLTDALMPGWVADIAHNPRQPIDDLAQNQCPSFVDGWNKHFVELDMEGNLIRAK